MIDNPVAEACLQWPLFILRVAVGLFFLQWGLEKILVVNVAQAVYAHFYNITLPANLSPFLGIAEFALAIAIIAGFQKKITYGAAFVVHFLSVAATWKQLIDPYGFIWGGNNHLFMTAVPLLAAMWLLFRLREYDTKWSIS